VRYAEALAYLDAHLNREAVAGKYDGLTLEPIERLVGALGDPHLAYPVIHVTGTNGKGSTAHLISALLEAQGLSVGLYTSPHYERVNERLARNRQPVDDEELALAISEVAVAEQVSGVTPSYFEILTAAALGWFAEVAVDVAVVEVGLLGAFDATNVVHAEVAVVTNVGRDHTRGEGDWRRAIAEEKAGIIEPDSHLILGPVGDDIANVFLDRPARERWSFGREIELVEDLLALGGRQLRVRTPVADHEAVYLPVHGAHQAVNASLALAAAEAFFGRALADEVIADAWAELELPGRVEIVARHPMVVLDGAHNPDGAEALRTTLYDVARGGRQIVVLGMLEGREPEAIVAALGIGPGDLVVVCEPDSPRRIEARALAAVVAAAGAMVEVVPEVADALDRAVALAGEDDLVLVTGSIYTVGAARSAWRAGSGATIRELDPPEGR
jgi:dihydrofolate synthase / folylpolyglutamate synthase